MMIFPWFLKTKGSQWLPKTKSVDVMIQASLKAFIRCRWCEIVIVLQFTFSVPIIAHFILNGKDAQTVS